MEAKNGAEKDSKSVTYTDLEKKKTGEDHLLFHIQAPVCAICDQGHPTDGYHYLPSIRMVVKKSEKGNIKNFNIQDQSKESSISWYFPQGMPKNFFSFQYFLQACTRIYSI